MVQEIVRNMLVYVVMVTILKGLVSDKGFLEIFRFASGLILILLFASPLLSVFSLDAGWYQKLGENIFRIDKKQMEQEMRVADGSFEKILWKECESQVKQQIRQLAQEDGQISQEVEVSLREGEDGEWFIEQVSMTVGQEAREAMGTGGEDIEQVQEIVIEPGAGQAAEEDSLSGDVWQDTDTRRLKRKICKKFQLPEEVVDVWKRNGEN